MLTTKELIRALSWDVPVYGAIKPQTSKNFSCDHFVFLPLMSDDMQEVVTEYNPTYPVGQVFVEKYKDTKGGSRGIWLRINVAGKHMTPLFEVAESKQLHEIKRVVAINRNW